MTATWQRPSLCDLLTQSGHRHKSFNTSAVVRRLIASCHNQPNAFGAKLLVSTSLLLTNWRTLLSNYSDKIVVDFLPYGWPINYTTSTLPASSLHNHPSASHFDSHVQAYIDSELAWNAIARPLEYLPFFDDFVCSPLQTVTKRGSPTWRVVMDLSFLQAAPSVTVFLKILIWANILSYNYPRLIGLSNSLLRKVATVLFPKKTYAELIVSFPLIRRITIYSLVIIRANVILSLVLSVYIRQHWFSNAQQRRLSISSPSRGS